MVMDTTKTRTLRELEMTDGTKLKWFMDDLHYEFAKRYIKNLKLAKRVVYSLNHQLISTNVGCFSQSQKTKN